MLKILITLSLLFCSSKGIAQADSIIKLTFSDTNNFNHFFEWDFKKPTRYFLLSNTEKWGGLRFKLDDDLKNDSVLKKIKWDEHHPYHHTYLFKDSMLDHLFSDGEKQFLYEQAIKSSIRPVPKFNTLYTLINSEKTFNKGFFFAMAYPIFSSDNKYAFIDIRLYYREKKRTAFCGTYYGSTVIVYQNIPGKGWVKLTKRDHVCL